ncbi:MAG: KpsF/GutQ family sugar-phosphate isomerase [Pseudomonadota bacterium]|nr:KpsF/GutQ family sugar-phosphate isomerase [Pseudomonadota bacterium]MEC8665952.1 KpsF/GutQ family sugar-phosphate isomerase [Pseudomonadota bacterium]
MQSMKMANAPEHNDIDVARRVLETEIQGLQALSASMNQSFAEAVAVINAMKQGTMQGRLIITGIGKSGHVGRKLAATFASTGTPSYFVHAGEASHGDLGMITEHDVVLMLSNSGENAELSDLIHYTRRFGIALIAMTGNPNSTLAKHADIQLLIPKVAEACPNGLAPTTSTTMMLALGDALAVCLLERMGLTEEQFKVFHPGGKLGQKLQKVSDIMHGYDDLPLISEDKAMGDAILVLSEKNLGCVIVQDASGAVKGVITDGDLKRHMSDDLLTKPVTDVMSTTPVSIESDALAVEAMSVMTQTKGRYLTSLLVMKDGKLAGMIRLQDCLQAGIA